MHEAGVRRNRVDNQMRFAHAVRDIASTIMAGEDEGRNHRLAELRHPPHARVTAEHLAKASLSDFAERPVHKKRGDPVTAPFGIRNRASELVGIVPSRVGHCHGCDDATVEFADDAEVQRVVEEVLHVAHALQRMRAVAVHQLEELRQPRRVTRVRPADDQIRHVATPL